MLRPTFEAFSALTTLRDLPQVAAPSSSDEMTEDQRPLRPSEEAFSRKILLTLLVDPALS